jgi:hypothetical protein
MRPVAALGISDVDDPATKRAFDAVGAAVIRLQEARSRAQLTADLVVGRNVIRHGLGRAVVGYTLTATVANAAFAHAIDASNTKPDLEVWITVIGVAQPGARLEVW